jgi:initiation factor 1A
MVKKKSKLSSKVGLVAKDSAVIPEADQRIAKVVKLLGGDRLAVTFSDGSEHIVRIPGKFRDQLLFRVNSFVLVRPLISGSDDRYDVLYRYNRDEVDYLIESHGFEEW